MTTALTKAELAAQDLAHMSHALALAERGLYTTDPNPRVGCVLAQGGRRLGQGWHERAGGPHAEVVALREAGAAARGATAYVTLEPCNHTGRTPPCAEALIAAGVRRVVCSTKDPNGKVAGGGIEHLRAAGIEVSVGVMAAEARELNVGFFSRFERGRPFVRLKLAMSLDARTAPASGGPLWISGEASRADVQTWRARSSAVLTGAGTVRIDDPQLNVRLAYGPFVRQPLRVVLDTELRCSRGARIFDGGGALVFAAQDASPGARHDAPAAAPHDSTRGTPREPSPEEPQGVAIERVPRHAGGVDLQAVLDRLAAREVNELLVECGPTLAGAFAAAGLIDELILYVAPTLLGENAAPLMRIGTARAAGTAGAAGTAVVLGALPDFEFRDLRRIGDDVRLILNRKRS